MNTDDRGLPLSTDVPLAADRYRAGVALTLAAWPGAAREMEAAIAADPDFALPHAMRARQHVMAGDPAQSQAAMARARELVGRRGDGRERSHVEILALATAGRSAEALARTLEHVADWPRDAVILSLPMGAFGLFAFSGMADHDQARADLCARHAGAYGEDDWWFLSTFGWALVENREVARGRAMLEQALAQRRANANAVHGLAHALFESGAHDEAERLLDEWLPGYGREGVLHGHLWWHGALAALERGDAEAALRAYAENVHPSVSKGIAINIVSDAASLLWRLDAYGHGGTEARWREIADYARQRFPAAGHAFVDAHVAMIEAATGDRAGLERRIAALEAMAGSGRLSAGAVVPALGKAALAFAGGEYRTCVRILEAVAAEVVRIGGSGAQRQVFEDTLIVALMRAGDTVRARNLLDRRLHRRPSPRDARWRAELAQA